MASVDAALNHLAVVAGRRPIEGGDLAGLLADLSIQIEAMADMARTLALEHGEDIGADMLFWARATQWAVESHRHDLAQADSGISASTRRLSTLEDKSRSMARAMEFGFLLDHDRSCRSDIAWPMARLIRSCYDLLPRRGWRVSRSPAHSCPPLVSAYRTSRRLLWRRLASHGPGRCSSI
jgi:cyclic beta-1,2-glucan synthetase